VTCVEGTRGGARVQPHAGREGYPAAGVVGHLLTKAKGSAESGTLGLCMDLAGLAEFANVHVQSNVTPVMSRLRYDTRQQTPSPAVERMAPGVAAKLFTSRVTVH